MKIFTITPKNQDAPEWANSRYKGVAIVRAEDEDSAGRMAQLQIEGIQDGGKGVPQLWWESRYCTIKEDDSGAHPAEGPSGLIVPDRDSV